MKNWKKILIGFLVLILLLFSGLLIYTNDFYKADKSVYDFLESEDVDMYEDEIIIFHGNKQNDTGKGFIFYPGGKVEYTSYIPLLGKLSEKGLTSVLVKMPFNLAIFQQDAGEKIYELLPNIDSWYVGGHSLGGAMADRYASNASKDIKGLILLAAYPVENKNIPAISIVGEYDKILSQEKPKGNYKFLEIQGGNHAYFGNYGDQEGDGKATITSEEQQKITINAIMDFINGS